jgi:eukaryotic-like serine/threonine-protein kinase
VPGVISVGSRVGGYTVIRLLGRGGMGQVFLAEHQRIARRVAVKVLLPELSANESVIERFFTEARATSLIRHPGIVEVLDCDVLDNQAFIVMEFLEGESLAGYLARVGSLRGDLGFALAVIGQVAEAVGAAHASDIVHRDLKPDNIFLCASTRHARVVPKVLDFGIAKLAVQGVAGQTKTGMLMGTPAYMSPEQCRGGSKGVDGRSDVYSLGCILYEVLCGQPPFVRDGAGELIVAHVAEPPVDPRKLVPELPPPIGALVLRMLAKNVEDRPADMSVVSAEIARCMAGLGISRPPGELHPRRAVEVPQIPGSVGPLAMPTPGAAARSPVPAAPSSVPAPPRNATSPLSSQPTQVAAESQREAVPVPTTLEGASGQQSTMPPEELPRRSVARWAVPAALAAGGVLALVVVMSRPGVAPAPAAAIAAPPVTAVPSASTSPSPPVSPVAPPVALAPPAPPPTSVAIEVRGLPVGGDLLLDGAPAASPLKLRRDGRRHLVIARAPGFYDRTIELEADRDQAVDVVLTAMARSEKPRGHESGGGSHHASPSHGTAATPPAPKVAEPVAPARPLQNGNGKKKTNYDEM